MRRKFKGFIISTADERKYINNLDVTIAHTFCINGYWTSNGKKVSSYVLCDENGNELEEYSHIQFSRNARYGLFYIESIN